MPELEPINLPDELKSFLATQEFACLSVLTDLGTAYILKAPGLEIDRCRGPLPISIAHQLYLYPTAPVIRTLIALFDQPDSQLVFESFTNAADPAQAAEFASLDQQDTLVLFFFDQDVRHRLTKRVRYGYRSASQMILSRAELYLGSLPPERFDFDLARAQMIQDYPLSFQYGTI